MSSGSSTSTLLVAGSALLVASLGLGLMSSLKGGSDPSDLGDIEDEEFITEDDVAKVFDRLFLEMQGVLSQLMQQIQQLQMAGQMIPEKQLKGLLRAEMERALTIKQKIILEQFDIDYDCLEEATWEFLENEEEHSKVKRAVERFQKLWENATGDEVVGWRPGKDASNRTPTETLNPERTIEVAEKYFSALTNNMRSIVNQYKEQGKNLQDQNVQQQLNLDFAQTANDAGEKALLSEGVTMNQFEASIKSHSNNPTVGRALGMLQMKQQQDLMSIQA